MTHENNPTNKDPIIRREPKPLTEDVIDEWDSTYDEVLDIRAALDWCFKEIKRRTKSGERWDITVEEVLKEGFKGVINYV